jgi:hypothetical protein
MNDNQRRRDERLIRVRDFGQTRIASFPADSRGGLALAAIDTIIEEIDTLDASRSGSVGGARAGTLSRRDARERLRAQVSAISKTAKAIGLDFPEVKNRFPLPRTNVNDSTLLSTARSFAAEAQPLKTRFIEYDLPADFLDKLNAAIDDFEEAINQQNTSADSSTQTRTAIDAALARAEQELERFDTAVRNKFAGDEATLAAWERARRLERAPRSSGNNTQTPPPTP